MLIKALTDSEIDQLVHEPKDIPLGLSPQPKGMNERNGHLRKDYTIECSSGNRFVVKIRQSCVNPLNFSVILGYVLPGSYTVFRLRRYNGKSHYHRNVLEGDGFYDFHVHTATQRYQMPGFDADHVAERTGSFWNLQSAIERLLSECGFGSPLSGTPLFP